MDSVDVWFNFAGVVFQIAGVAVTVYGFRRTWAAFSTGPFPPFDWVRHRGRRLWAWVQHVILRRRRNVVVVVGTGALGVGGAFNARVRIGHGPLPPGTVKAQLAVLDQRVKDLATSAFNEIDALEDAVNEIRRDLRAVDIKVDETAAGLEAQDRRVALGGIEIESLGLVLIMLGLMLQGVGAFLGTVVE